MIISLIKSKFLLKQFLKRINMRWVLFDIVILEFRTPVDSNCVLNVQWWKSFNL